MISDDNVKRVLKDDGVKNSLLKPGHEFENVSSINIRTLEDKLKFNGSWAVRVIYNNRFGGVIIKQNPGEGNRLHYHPDADECWVILEGEYEWEIDNKVKTVSVGDIVVVKANVLHKITAVGNIPAARLAITKPDVEHIYAD
jgi:mannose-6-phosphate isomerase-like protein (cupin superfamily)